jgi:hypothetical protein
VSDDDIHHLTAVATTSPQITHQLNTTTQTGNLRGFAIQPADINAGASYHPGKRVVCLTLPTLRGRDPDTDADLAFLLGHELHHAVLRDLRTQAWHHLLHTTDHAARTNSDYTTAITNYITAMRWDEDTSNIKGWNAFVQHARTTTEPLPRMVKDYPRAEMVAEVAGSRVVLREGFMPNPDLTIPLTPHNVAAMSRYYSGADRELINIGVGRDADYPNYYGAQAISVVAFAHRAALNEQRRHEQRRRHAATGPPFPEKPIVVNFAAHRLHPPLMESAGITLPDPTPLGYVDVSTTPPTQGVLHHTLDDPSGTSPVTLLTGRHTTRANKDRPRTGRRLRTGQSLHPPTSRPHVAGTTDTHGLSR